MPPAFGSTYAGPGLNCFQMLGLSALAQVFNPRTGRWFLSMFSRNRKVSGESRHLPSPLFPEIKDREGCLHRCRVSAVAFALVAPCCCCWLAGLVPERVAQRMPKASPLDSRAGSWRFPADSSSSHWHRDGTENRGAVALSGSLCVEAGTKGPSWGRRREGKGVSGSPATASLNSWLGGRLARGAHSLLPLPHPPLTPWSPACRAVTSPSSANTRPRF